MVRSRLALLDPSQGLLVYILPRSPTTAACWDHPPSQVVRCTLRTTLGRLGRVTSQPRASPWPEPLPLPRTKWEQYSFFLQKKRRKRKEGERRRRGREREGLVSGAGWRGSMWKPPPSTTV